jgi:hypothetical protein
MSPDDDSHVVTLLRRFETDDHFVFDTSYTKALIMEVMIARSENNASTLARMSHAPGMLAKANELVMRDAGMGTRLTTEKAKLSGVVGRLASALSDISRYLLLSYEDWYVANGYKTVAARKDNVKETFHAQYAKVDEFELLIQQIDMLLDDIRQSYLAYNFLSKSIQLSSLPNNYG